jgi:hypothetical protein
MPLTRKALAEMDEATLRTRVLIPLFEAMGFLDVFEYHGGAQELGKDIVMWKRDAIRDRLNYAVVAKAGRITGRANGRSSAGEVTIQVQEAFGAPYQDPRSQLERRVDRCIVVSSRDIKKEATIAICGALRGQRADGHVDFISGDKLWRHIQEFMPGDGAVQKLFDVGEVLASASKHHEVIAIVGPDGLTFTTKPKHVDAHAAEPLIVRAQLAFPETPEGLEALAEMRRHIETGAPVSVPQQFVKNLELPEVLRSLIGEHETPNVIQLGARRGAAPLQTNIIARSESGEVVRIDGIRFDIVQAGTSEITFDNAAQLTGWHFVLRVRPKDQTVRFTFDIAPVSRNVHQQLLAVSFLELAALGAVLAIEDANSGLEIFNFQTGGERITPPEAGLREFLERLAIIQRAANVPIAMPDRLIAQDEVEEVYGLAEAVQTGHMNGSSTGELQVSAGRAGAENALLAAGSAPVVLDIPQETWPILDQQIPVGRVIWSFEGMGLSADQRAALADQLQSQPESETFDFRLSPLRNGRAACSIRFERWLPREEAALLAEVP